MNVCSASGFFNALVLKGVFQKAKECLRGEISGYDCSRRLNIGAWGTHADGHHPVCAPAPLAEVKHSRPDCWIDTRIELVLETNCMDGGCDIKLECRVQ